MTATGDVTATPIDPEDLMPFHELSDSGLLWLINRVVFHPRGYRLAIQLNDQGMATGWRLHWDGGTQPGWFPEDDDIVLFNSAESTLALARLRWIRRTADQLTEPF